VVQSINHQRRLWLATLSGGALGLLGCAQPQPGAGPDPALVSALAPTGSLRVGVYPGSPTSLVRDARSGQVAGLAYELGLSLAQKLGVLAKVLEFPRVAEVVEALKLGQVDFTVTNASAARAQWLDFSSHLVELELGLLVPEASSVRSMAEADRPEFRIGVTAGSSSLLSLPQKLKQPRVVPVLSLEQAQQMLSSGTLDAFATNKGILFEMARALPGFRVLTDDWGTEGLAMAIPKGRTAGLAYLNQFAEAVRSDGSLQSMLARSGLRGVKS